MTIFKSVIANYVLNYRDTSIAKWPSLPVELSAKFNKTLPIHPVLYIRYSIRITPFIFHCAFKFQDPRILLNYQLNKAYRGMVYTQTASFDEMRLSNDDSSNSSSYVS